MKINRQNLLTLVTVLARVIPAKSGLNYTQNIRLQSADGKLQLRCSDGETDIVSSIPFESEGENDSVLGSVPCAILLNIVKNIDDESLSVTADASVVKVSWKEGHATLPNLGDEFPAVILPKDPANYSRAGAELEEGIGVAGFAVAKDMLRPAMNSICLNFTESVTDIVATDSRILVCKPSTAGDARGNVLIPERIAKLIKGSCSEVEEVIIESSAQRTTLRLADTAVTYSSTTNAFPNYNSVFPKTASSKLTAETKTLIQTIKRISVTDPMVKVSASSDLTGGTVTFSAASYFSNSKETLSCDYEGEPVEIAFNASHLIDVLSNIRLETVTLSFNGPTKPVTITSDTEGATRAIVMPVKAPTPEKKK